MTKRTLNQFPRQGVEAVVGALLNDNHSSSADAGQRLVSQAKLHNLGLRDYLNLAIDPRLGDDKSYADAGLSGYDAAKAYLGLPTRDDFQAGILLEAASETFQTYAGSRALFPEVMDDIVRWKHRPDQFEQIAPFVSNSRVISGNEIITTVVNDSADDYKVMAAIAEGSRIPIYSIKASENSVKMFKHGMGYETTYEFNRRARLDLITPYANRALREAERSKVAAATSLLVNGDSVHSAAAVVGQSTLGVAGTANGTISEGALLQWLVNRAKAGFPIDTVVGNWDSYVAWLKLFGIKDANNGDTKAEVLQRQGFLIGGVPILQGRVNFVISSTAPAGKLIGYSAGDTMEELVEANALISESEQSIKNQTITYVRTETTGYRLVFGDTRSIFDYADQ